MPLHCHHWTVRHGDSSETPWFGLLTGSGEKVDLEGATLRAQVRDRAGSLVHTFSPGTGIELRAGTATFPDGRPPVDTTAIRLVLSFADSEALPRKLRGATYDLELTRAGIRRTVVGGEFTVVPDVTHD